MPRYFFHVRDGRSHPDLDGTELPDLYAARRQAVRLLGELLIHQPEACWRAGEFHVEVADDTGRVRLVLRFEAGEQA